MTKDKTPTHSFLTLELIRRKFLKDASEFELYMYDQLFEELLQQYNFNTVVVSTSYTISNIKKNKYKSEDNEDIRCLYAYFRAALIWNLKRITGDIHIDWIDDDYY